MDTPPAAGKGDIVCGWTRRTIPNMTCCKSYLSFAGLTPCCRTYPGNACYDGVGDHTSPTTWVTGAVFTYLATVKGIYRENKLLLLLTVK